MKTFKNNTAHYFTVLFLLAGLGRMHAQNEFYNNGSGVTVQSGGLITVQGEVVNPSRYCC